MSLQATPVTAAGNGYYFALTSDPGLNQTLSLTGNTIAISGGNSVNVANATLVSTSAVKLTAQTYIAGFNTTNFTGDVRSEGRVISAPPLGLGTATLNGSLANVTITGIAGNNPSVLFEKGVDKASIVYNGSDLLMSTVKVSTMSVKAELYDSFGSPGAAGQQLQSSGPGLGTVWGAGSGVGLTAVIAGSNIGVDNTNPIAPVVSLSINSTINMNGFNIVNGNDIQLKGTNPSVDFKNSAGVDKAFLDYVESSDKITLSGKDVVAESVGAGRGHRMILDAAGAALTSQDADVTIQRSETGVGIKTIMTVEDNGLIQIGAAGIGGNPTLTLQSGSNVAEFLNLTYNPFLTKGTVEVGANDQLLFKGGSSFTMESGGTTLIDSADAVTIDAQSGDSSILMNASITANATTDIQLQIGGFTQATLGGAGNIGVGGYGADGSVFLLKNGLGSYGAFYYNGANDTLNMDNGGSGISVGVNGITTTPATGVLMIEGDNTIGKTPQLNFNDLGGGYNINLQYGDLGAGRPTLTAQYAHQLGTFLGVGEGFTIGYDQNGSGTNCAFGIGGTRPTRISYSEPALLTDYIELNPTSGINLNAVGVNITAGGGAGTIKLGGITAYDDAYAALIAADVDNLNQVLSNNAYIPMTWYKRDISLSVDGGATLLAFETDEFTWRYSGNFGGNNGDSRYCQTRRVQIDVNISAEDLGTAIAWWAILEIVGGPRTGAVYPSTEYPDERFGYLTDYVINPSNNVKNTTASFSSTYNLDPTFTGQPDIVDGDVMRIRVFSYANNSITSPRAQVSATIRPLRTLI